MVDSHRFPGRNATTDEWQWLEDIHGDEPLAWVDAQNERTLAAFDIGRLEHLQRRILEVLDATDRIPHVTRKGKWLYNFWRDAEHPRGLWRRTTFESYRTEEPDWDILLDVDALGEAEGTEWVYAGASLLYPDFERALIRLSPDGGDAIVVREFDLPARSFVEGGFSIPHAKTGISWIDRDSVLVSTDFGPGTMTESSYPRQIRVLRRGQSLPDAALVHEIPADHMGIWGGHDHAEGFERDLFSDRIDFYRASHFIRHGDRVDRIDVPEDAEVDVHREWLAITLRSDWSLDGTTWQSGSLLIARLDEFLAGSRQLQALFVPDERTSLAGFDWTRNGMLIALLRDVATVLEVATHGDGGWCRVPIASTMPNQTMHARAVDPDEGDDFWLVSSGFVQPETLHLGTIGSDHLKHLKSAPSFFSGPNFAVEQHFAVSDDGTRVPYFEIAPASAAPPEGRPALMYGYGGFEIPITPGYNGVVGRAWLEAGGVYVVANIRGGGEYGPAWHKAALRENRHRAYEDFAAIARDLVARGVTTPERLGCIGGSNGGLLVGNMLTHYPELFGAIVCEVPLLDMKRYIHLSAGASWIAEYGDPDNPEDWAFIQTISPYHNLRSNVSYPPILFYTATSDDRVGPVQARKVAARMQSMGIPDVLFYENREGGHGGAADNEQRAHMDAMAYQFLREHLMR